MSNYHSLLDKYIILEHIGKGAFGDVYKATNISNNKNVAMKVEKRQKYMTRLLPEYKIYCKLFSRNCRKYVPRVYEFLQTDDFNIITMELLGSSLEDIFNSLNKKFSLSTVLFLGISILKSIEQVHRAGFIHRDIKPNNFLTGYTNKQNIYLTDFGLSKEFITPNQTHIKETFNHSIVGTARYSSINMHLGFEPSRRDDLESIGYMLIYFANGKLPWQGVCKDKNKQSIFESIGNVKLSISIENLCENLPLCFANYLKYCRNLQFSEKPNYSYLIKLFANTIQINNFNCMYEWM